MEKKEFVCSFCNKKFPSGKSLGGHKRIHSMFPLASDTLNVKKKNNKKMLVDQKQQQQQQQERSLKAVGNHYEEGEKMVMDNQSGATMKRSKKLSNSESCSVVSSSYDPEIEQAARNLMLLKHDKRPYSLAESSEKSSQTKVSSGELLKMDKAAVDDNMRSASDDDYDSDSGASDSYSSDSDYFMKGPKKSGSDISVDGSLRDTGVGSGLNRSSNGEHLGGVKEGRSEHESESCADTNSKIHRSSVGKSLVVKKASKNSKGHHVCPICSKVYSSAQALGGHKRSHNIANQRHKAADTQLDLNLPADQDSDE